jgi:hypothetical protein
MFSRENECAEVGKTMTGTSLYRLTDCLHDRVARRAGVWMGAAFVVLYLYSVGNIVIAPGTDLAFGRPIPAASVVSDWTAKMWKPIAPFVWEPIAAFYLTRSVALFISVPNLFLAFLLGTLVALNMAIAIARARAIVTVNKRTAFVSGLLPSLPALLTGFTCCVPTVILALSFLATGFGVAAIVIAPYFLPVAAIALIANLLWALRQISCAVPSGPKSKPGSNLFPGNKLTIREG